MRHFFGLSVAAFAALSSAACQPQAPASEEPQNSQATEVTAASDVVETHLDIADGSPGLWTLADEDTTVHLFGTVHILKPDLDWQTDGFRDIFNQADAVYFEADTAPDAVETLAPIVAQLAPFTGGQTLESVLDDEELREVREAAELVGVPMVSLNAFRPWFASLNLTELHLIKSGYEQGSGVEVVLTQAAEAAGKELRFLETAEFQLRLLAGLSDDEAEQLLVQTAIEIEDNPDALDELVAEWAEGDTKALADMLASDEAFGSGEVYEKLLVRRNADWTDQIIALMADEPGEFFIAVGAAHLAGEDSVQSMLEAEGYQVARQ